MAPSLTKHLWTANLPREHGFEPLEVEGTLPPQLRGTLYRNGPGQFGQFGTMYSHPFESDGAMTAIKIEDGKAFGASRIHATAGLTEERAAGHVLYGFTAPWWRRVRNTFKGNIKNTANTSVVAWQGRLFALVEAGKPTEVDPKTLQTIGATDLDGVVVSAFSAHPHRVASRKAIYNFGLEYGRHTKLHAYELPDVGPARHLAAIELPGPPMLHDFIATETHLIWFLSPVYVDLPRMFSQIGGFEKMFRWKPERGTQIICMPIDRPAEVIRFDVEAFYQWHFANAFDRGASEIVVDYVRYPDNASFYTITSNLDGGTYHRATIDLKSRSFRSEQLSDRACEFPTIAPGGEGRSHDIAYVALEQLTGIGSIDPRGRVIEHKLPADQRATEPLFVDGYLLSLCHTHDRAFVGVYDAARIPDGPVAKLWFDHHVPITFHGTFVK